MGGRDNMRVVREARGASRADWGKNGFGQTCPWACSVLMKEIWVMEIHRTDASSWLTTCLCKHLTAYTLKVLQLCVFPVNSVYILMPSLWEREIIRRSGCVYWHDVVPVNLAKSFTWQFLKAGYVSYIHNKRRGVWLSVLPQVECASAQMICVEKAKQRWGKHLWAFRNTQKQSHRSFSTEKGLQYDQMTDELWQFIWLVFLASCPSGGGKPEASVVKETPSCRGEGEEDHVESWYF